MQLRRIESLFSKLYNPLSADFSLTRTSRNPFAIFYLRRHEQKSHPASISVTNTTTTHNHTVNHASQEASFDRTAATIKATPLSSQNDCKTFEKHHIQIVNTLKNAPQDAKAFIFYDHNLILSLIRSWRSRYPRVQPFYTVRYNPIEQIISAVVESHMGFSCGSQKEIETVRNIIARRNAAAAPVFESTTSNNQQKSNSVTQKPPVTYESLIHFTNPIKEQSELQEIMSGESQVNGEQIQDVQYLYADNLDELKKISDTTTANISNEPTKKHKMAGGKISQQKQPSHQLVWHFRIIASEQAEVPAHQSIWESSVTSVLDRSVTDQGNNYMRDDPSNTQVSQEDISGATGFKFGDQVSQIEDVERRLDQIKEIINNSPNKDCLKFKGIKLETNLKSKKHFLRAVVDIVTKARLSGFSIDMLNLESEDLNRLSVTQEDLDLIVKQINEQSESQSSITLSCNLEERFFEDVCVGAFKVLRKQQIIVKEEPKSDLQKQLMENKNFKLILETLKLNAQRQFAFFGIGAQNISNSQNNNRKNHKILSQDLVLDPSLYAGISKRWSRYEVVPKQSVLRDNSQNEQACKDLIQTRILGGENFFPLISECQLPRVSEKEDYIVLSNFGSGFYYKEADDDCQTLDVMELSSLPEFAETKVQGEAPAMEIEII